MKGQGDNWQGRVGAHLVGHGQIRGKLYDLGQFPGAVASSDPRYRVDGEVYRLDDIKRATKTLDEYEECYPTRPRQSLFVRKEMPVVMDDGTTETAWVYLYNRPVDESDLISRGSYRERMSVKR